eukprot:6193561-Pleurochrysis_carterae.AAC.2
MEPFVCICHCVNVSRNLLHLAPWAVVLQRHDAHASLAFCLSSCSPPKVAVRVRRRRRPCRRRSGPLSSSRPPCAERSSPLEETRLNLAFDKARKH